MSETTAGDAGQATDAELGALRRRVAARLRRALVWGSDEVGVIEIAGEHADGDGAAWLTVRDANGALYAVRTSVERVRDTDAHAGGEGATDE